MGLYLRPDHKTALHFFRLIELSGFNAFILVCQKDIFKHYKTFSNLFNHNFQKKVLLLVSANRWSPNLHFVLQFEQ